MKNYLHFGIAVVIIALVGNIPLGASRRWCSALRVQNRIAHRRGFFVDRTLNRLCLINDQIIRRLIISAARNRLCGSRRRNDRLSLTAARLISARGRRPEAPSGSP